MTPTREIPNMRPKPSARRIDDGHIRFAVGGIEREFTILTNEDAEILRNALTAALDERSAAIASREEQ